MNVLIFFFLSMYSFLLPFVAAKETQPSEAPSCNRESPLEYSPLILTLGEQRLIHLPNLKRYSLSGNFIRMIAIQNSHSSDFLLKGVAPGFSDLWVWKTDGHCEHRSIQVERISDQKISLPLERALQKLQETEVFFLSPSTVTLRGEVRSIRESAQIVSLKRAFPKEIQDETTLSVALLEAGLERLQKWAQKNEKFSQIQIEKLSSNIWVRGNFRTPIERQAIEQEIRAVFPAALLELDTLPDSSPTVYFRVFLLEIKRNHFRSLGLGWPSQQLNAFKMTSWGVEEAINLDIALQALETQGSVRILSRPELAVRAPGDAELFAGGELPIRTKTHFSSHVAWKPYGLLLRLKVTHIAGSMIRLEIQTEVSNLEPGAGTEDIPGLRANRMKTQVDAKMNAPILLSGLLQEDLREQARGLPWIRSIPVLGLLFGSEDYLNSRSELVAILLPMKAPPATSIPDKMVFETQKKNSQQDHLQSSPSSRTKNKRTHPQISFAGRLE